METSSVQALLWEAATLLGVGMIVVFSFLTILIGSVKLLTKICLALPQPEVVASPSANAPRTAPIAAASNVTSSDDTLAAIKAAVTAYRQGNTSQS
jgi:oxaloacetate decarboxylase gamma subunit